MKIKIILTIVAFIFATSFSFASFPVKRTFANDNQVQVDQNQGNAVLVSPAAASGTKSQGIALLLGIFLGGLAGHKWYLGNPWYINVLFIVTLGGLGVWWIIDMIRIITGDYQPHNGSYKADFF